MYNKDMYVRGNNKTVYINLRGGLGNQLFCYFFGKSIVKDLNVRVKFLYYSKSNPHHKSNSNINSFVLDDAIINVLHLSFFLNALILFLRSWVLRLFKCKFKTTRNDFKSFFLFDDIYDEPNATYLQRRNLIQGWITRSNSKILYVRGLFQDFSFFENCDIKNLTLADPSQNYKFLLSEIKATEPIIVHVRLGNYLGSVETLGVLSSEYYKSAINKACEKFPSKEIWIFSNSPQQAAKLLEPISNRRLHFISELDIVEPAETLLLMASSCVLVTSNSTLSLWSAKLATCAKLIILPRPFYKNSYFNILNYDRQWIQVDSKWLSKDDSLKI